ncbi:serpin family protein [Bifidobacterium scaligerum]|uniref:Serpin family protein n=1 Tax=Bifidobacterium scaligerum TaxID=2052656 RepID=A0A2M9HR47_9BIFI|nr:serpin family protein [Bifidobacterium scaligerum]PJM79288.1 serpin family protein [Bifidobacterium scaligerum]
MTSSTPLEHPRKQQHGRKRLIRIIAGIITASLLITAGGMWWTTGEGKIIVMNLFKPAARPATQAAADSVSAFAYQSSPEFLTMKSTQDSNGNVNYSPTSMWMALAIAAQGADGTTRSQMDDLLGTKSLRTDDYQSLLRSINGRYNGSKSEMSAANSLWVDSQYTLADAFKATVKGSFDANIQSLPFNDAAAKQMSHWISSHTKNVLKPNITLQDKEVISIINTVFADGRWKDPFEPEETTSQTFRGEDGDTEVPMMQRLFDDMVWAHDSDNDTWQRVSIPFDNGGSLTILLPAAGHFDEIASDTEKLRWAMSTCLDSEYGCTTDAPAGWGVAAEAVMVDVSLPKFTIDSTFPSDQTIATFRQLGLTDAFMPGTADLSKMTGSASDDLSIGSIIQGTRIEVNENGAKAAAFTKMGVEAAGAPAEQQFVEFTVDRPFLYALTTPDTIPLFIGAVRNL